MSITEAGALTGALIVGLLALVAIVAIVYLRQRTKVKIKGPGGTGIEIDGSNDPSPAIRAEGVTSHTGGLVADDGTGRGVDVKDIETRKDVRLTSRPNGPKA